MRSRVFRTAAERSNWRAAVQICSPAKTASISPNSSALRGVHRGRGQQHLQRRGRTHEPGQPLRPAGRGIDAQIDLRHAEASADGRHAVMAGHGELQRDADDIAGHRGHHGLGRVLDLLKGILKDARHQDRIFLRGDQLKQMHVRPDAEMVRRAQDDDPSHAGIFIGLPNSDPQHFQQLEGQRIQRRRVQPQQAHAVGDLVFQHTTFLAG